MGRIRKRDYVDEYVFFVVSEVTIVKSDRARRCILHRELICPPGTVRAGHFDGGHLPNWVVRVR